MVADGCTVKCNPEFAGKKGNAISSWCQKPFETDKLKLQTDEGSDTLTNRRINYENHKNRTFRNTEKDSCKYDK